MNTDKTQFKTLSVRINAGILAVMLAAAMLISASLAQSAAASATTPTAGPTPCAAPFPASAFCADYYTSASAGQFSTLKKKVASEGNSASPFLNFKSFDATLGKAGRCGRQDLCAVRWRGNWKFNSASYTFNVTADDGIRLYIDGALVIDQWKDQATVAYSYTRNMTAGKHLIKVEYYENGGGAVAVAGWTQNAPSDTAAPSVPQNLIALAVSSSQINLSWSASTDNVGVSDYRIYRGGSLITTTAATSYQNTGLSPSTAYSYTVAAYDAAGNASAQSTAASATTPTAGPTPCAAPFPASAFCADYYTSASAGQFSTLKNKVAGEGNSASPFLNFKPFDTTLGQAGRCGRQDLCAVRWQGNWNFNNASYTFNVTADDGIRLYIDGALVIDQWKDQATVAYSYTRNMTAGTHLIKVEYYENGGGAVAVAGWTQTSDTAAPSVPQNLVASAVSSSQINLSWSASTDNVGVSDYIIYRGGSLITTTAATSYQNTGLSPSTAYSYTVAAYDAAGYVSAQSAAASATTSTATDTTPPTVSITTPLAGASISGDDAAVSANATDNVGVAKVEFYVDGSLKLTDTSSPYSYAWSLTSVANGSYTFSVKAYDAAGNVGTASVTVTVNNLDNATSTTLLNNGPTTEKVDIVFLGDGYTSAEMSTYRSDVEAFMDYLFTQPPFSDYKSFFNVHRVDVISNESGVDNPNCDGTSVDTALDTGFSSTGSDCRLLNTYSGGKVETAADNAPAADAVLIIVNTLTYGGAAGSYGVFYKGFSGPEVMAHELGHSFGWLADEYDYGGSTTYNSSSEPNALNVTVNTNRSTLKWSEWVAPETPLPSTGTAADTPGLYEGARYSKYGIYRPTYNSKMRSTSAPFERVNYNLLVDRIFDWIPIDTTPAQITLSCGLPTADKASVKLTASDPESYVMAYSLSTSALFTDAPWQLASNQADFSLNLSTWPMPAGTPAVYAQIKNGYGTESMETCQPSGAVSVVVITSAGGIISTSDAIVSIPPFAIPSQIAVTVTDEKTDDADSISERAASAQTLRYTEQSSGVMLSPYGMRVDKPISVTISLKQAIKTAAASSADDIFVCAWDTQSKTWKALPSSLDAGKTSITAETDIFSVLKVFSFAPASATSASVGEVYVFPNPAKNGAKPIFHIETGLAKVEIQIHDFTGKLVHKETLTGNPSAHGPRTADAYEYEWDAANAASGVYFYVITIGDESGKTIKKGKFAVIK